MLSGHLADTCSGRAKMSEHAKPAHASPGDLGQDDKHAGTSLGNCEKGDMEQVGFAIPQSPTQASSFCRGSVPTHTTLTIGAEDPSFQPSANIFEDPR